MKNYLFTSIFLIAILGASCSKPDKEKVVIVDEFPKEINLKGEPFTKDSIPVFANHINLIGQCLVLVNYKPVDNKYFFVYDKNTGEMLNSFGTEGRGPEEFSIPIPIKNQLLINDTTEALWVLNQKSHKYECLNPKRFTGNGGDLVLNSYSLPDTEDFSDQVYKMANGDLVGTTMSGDGRFFLYDSTSQQTRYLDYFPLTTNYDRVPKQERQMLYSSQNGLSGDGAYFVSALLFFKRIDIFNQHLELNLSIVYPDSPKQPLIFMSPEKPTQDETIFYFYDLYLTKNLIYALNMNITNTQYMQVPGEVHVFTYAGEPVCRYKLDRFVYNIAMDEDNNRLLAIAYSELGEPQIMSYQLD